MNTQQNILDCYNAAAENYAAEFVDELSRKHFDRLILQAFTEQNKKKGRLIDLGCGPGQATRFIYEQGFKDVLGTDLSPAMINIAKSLHGNIDFEVADMLALKYEDASFGSAIAMYAIVHFDADELLIAFNEVYRVLKAGSDFLFSFHVGDEVIHRDEFLDQKVNVDFRFFKLEDILEIVLKTGFSIADAVVREPYPNVEYQSRRAYVWLTKASSKF